MNPELTDAEWAFQHFPERIQDSHKGTYGRVALFCGSHDMTGAAVLSARAAYRAGVGVVECFVPDESDLALRVAVPEAIVHTYSASEDRIEQAFSKIDFSRYSAILAGPGLSTKAYAKCLLEEVFTRAEAETPLVLDADALNLLALHEELREKLKKFTYKILTPHYGESRRLKAALQASLTAVEDIHKDVSMAELAQSFGAAIVDKGAPSKVVTPDGRCFINTTGNNGMSTAGSGDVLAGMITALAARGLSKEDAARLGVYAHGFAGDLASAERGQTAVMASDIICHICLEKACRKI